jgi:hypothetical protein
MREQRLRTKLFQTWLHPNELEFLKSYADVNMMTSSELVRGWIHEVMKREGYKIKEPSLPEQKSKNKRKIRLA